MSELIVSNITYRQGNTALNNAFSGTANFIAISTKHTLVGGPHTFDETDFLVVQAGPSNVTLPPASTRGRFVAIKNQSGGGINVVLDGADTIDGASGNYPLSNNECLGLISNSGNWFIVYKFV
jgi:hypothetical protein